MLLRHQNSFQGILNTIVTLNADKYRGRCATHRNAGSGYSEPRPFAAKLQGATGHEQVSSGPDGQFKALALTHTTMELLGSKGVEESRNSPLQDDKTKSVAMARQRLPLAGTIQN
ncbi:hypothetical protein NEUTE1DRAFT_102712 [Neurospora tetrasperma FGSC 2508]|uniref:Uncharacterized protein n=1 Tax=Neurospora tetrasperma (strain FGSC 2508 / ATCC MYA-4615 / P0657) TaxID=510951 RepID=F8MTE6_NEUT8|nr:uncharacterized protein NEUTE1DRAFT_102712 [Neurospora tetrasperma FGSC 2508]EGO55278.1 hypothetical protein NEUTE1DRAFT_102712 [Neurospora tetrasperma FGSC 2508]